MKLSILPVFVASAGLLAAASPMRVILVSSSQQPDGPVAQLKVGPSGGPRPIAVMNAVPEPNHAAGPCGLRAKAGSFATAFRLALGFGPKEETAGAVRIQPFPFIGTPQPSQRLKYVNLTKPVGDRVPVVPHAVEGGDLLRIVEGKNGADGEVFRIFPHVHEETHHHPHHPHAHGHKHGERPSFLMRVHFALMSLGPWEGRAVAFVLGCGIGVLLRMFWVLTLLAVRALRAPCASSSPALPLDNEHEDDYYFASAGAGPYVLVRGEADAEELVVAAPTYTVLAAAYPAEKVEEKVEESK